MNNSDNAATRDPVENVCAEFEQRQELLEEVCAKTKTLIEDCLKDSDVRYQSVQARVKRKDKLRSKYLEKKYTKLDDITDQAGLRVITYYDDELDRVVGLIKREFTVIPDKSVDKRVMEPDKFGYRAINLVCTHSDNRKSDVQFKKQASISFEIQVTSVLGHAWSEMEHDWYDLKDSYPDQIKRRFSQLAALIEIAESQFIQLRDERLDYRRSVGVQVEAELPDVPVDAVSLKAFASQEPLVARLDEVFSTMVDRPLGPASDQVLEFWSRATRAVELTTVQALRDSMKRHEAGFLEYLKQANQIFDKDWRKTAGRPLPTGTSIYQFTVMLAASGGEEKLIQFWKTLRMNSGDDLQRLVGALTTLARKISEE